MQDIHLFVPKYNIEACLQEIRDCLECGWTGAGYKTLEFERRWCAYTGLANAHFLNSATAGLHLAVRILKAAGGWQEGDEIITTPFTFVSTNHSILYENLKPIFADIDEYLCLDPKSVAARIGPRTRAVLFVGHGGSSGRWSEIVELCRRKGLSLILDAVHQSGTTFAGRVPALDADVAVFSFQAVKNLPTSDSGMVCFKSPENDATARRLSWLGIDKDTYQRTVSNGRYKWRYEVDEIGFKYQGNSLAAAVALAQLPLLEQDNARRREMAARYDTVFAGQPAVRTIPQVSGCRSSRHLYQIRANKRDDLIHHLNDHRIFPGVHYRDNTTYCVYRHAAGSCPRAAVVSLPH